MGRDLDDLDRAKAKLEKLVDRMTLFQLITELAYEGLFDYRDNCILTRQMNWFYRNKNDIMQARFLVPILFDTKKR